MLGRLFEQQQAICAALESENRDVRPLMPSIVKSLQLLRKLHRSLKPFILLLKWSVGKNIPPLALFMAGHGEVFSNCVSNPYPYNHMHFKNLH